MLKKLVYANRKKIKKAKEVFETYHKLNNLIDTGKACGCSVNTVRRYIALIEDIKEKEEIKNKDKYYSTKYLSTYNKVLNKEVLNNKVLSSNNIEDINSNIDSDDDSDEVAETIIESDSGDIDVILANKIPDIKDTKARILAEKLDTIAFKYLEYLDNPSEQQLHRTSLKDRAVIAGILLDKKSQLQQKAADSIKNQSIIFNLFGDNKNLAEFITGNMKRQQALQSRPVKQYKEA